MLDFPLDDYSWVTLQICVPQSKVVAMTQCANETLLVRAHACWLQCSCAAYKSGCTGNAARTRAAGMPASRPPARATARVVAALLLLVPRLADGKLCTLPDPSSEHLAMQERWVTE